MQLKYLGITVILVLLLNVLSVLSQNDVVTDTGNSNSNELEGSGSSESSSSTSNNVTKNEETSKTTASTSSSSSGSNRSYRRNTSTRTVTTTVSKSTQTSSHNYSSNKANPVGSGSTRPSNNVESSNSNSVNTDTKTVSNDDLNANTINEEANNNSQNDVPINNNEFVEFLDKIKFKFIKPEEYTTIYSNTYLNVQWESEYINENEIRNIGVYLQGLDNNVNGVSEGSFIRSYINLNDKGGNYPIGELNGNLSEYALWLYTNDYGSNMFYQGPILINGNCTNPDAIKRPQNIENVANSSGGGINSKYLLLFIFAVAVLFFVAYFVNLYMNSRRKDNDDYKNFKEYTSVPQNENQFDIDNKKPKEMEKIKEENLQKVDQVYNSKVLKNPDIDKGNITPFVDVSYKSSLDRNKGYASPVESNKSSYDRKLKNKSQPNNDDTLLNINSPSSMNSLGRNKVSDYGSPGSINSNKILSQSTNYSMSPNSDGDQRNRNESQESDEDYINKNSFCLNNKNTNDTFENYYLNQQNNHGGNTIVKKKSSTPLVATVTTVEEYLATHRNSLNSVPNSRTSSLMNLSNSSSSSFLMGNPPFNVISKLDKYNHKSRNSNVKSSVVPNMNESILDELNSLERKIKQQKQMYMNSLQGIDSNQLNLQNVNLQQQGIVSGHLLPAYPMNQASPPVKPKTVTMNSPPISSPSNFRNNVNSPLSAVTLYNKSPSGIGKVSKNKASDNVLDNYKSQESETTLPLQATQDTLGSTENEDDIETKVATHICKAWYSPNMSDELRMCPGDELIILEKFNDGWGLGQNTEGNVGVFPLDCVTIIDPDKSSSFDSTSLQVKLNQDNDNVTNNDSNYSFQNGNVPIKYY